MCSIITLLMLAFAGFLGYAVVLPQSASMSSAQAVEVATVESPEVVSCESVSEDEDIRAMLALVDDTFRSGVWSRTISGDGSKTTATWETTTFPAVASLEWLHYDCGVTQAQIDEYYSPAGFDVLLSNYSSYEKTAECRFGDTRFYEFDATNQGGDFHVRYWVKQVSPTRVAGLMLVFPTSEEATMATYAGRLFPELPSCEAAAG